MPNFNAIAAKATSIAKADWGPAIKTIARYLVTAITALYVAGYILGKIIHAANNFITDLVSNRDEYITLAANDITARYLSIREPFVDHLASTRRNADLLMQGRMKPSAFIYYLDGRPF
jgi:hypothetical protein